LSCCQEFESTCNVCFMFWCVRVRTQDALVPASSFTAAITAQVCCHEICAQWPKDAKDGEGLLAGVWRGEGGARTKKKTHLRAHHALSLSPELCTLRAPLYRTPTCSHGSQDDKEDVGGGGGARSYPSVVCRGWVTLTPKSNCKAQTSPRGAPVTSSHTPPESEFCQTQI
jgi:hypothetical protein